MSANATSTSICTSRSPTHTSMCTIRITSTGTTSRGMVPSRTRTRTAMRGYATVIRTIRTCTTGTGTRNGVPACAGTTASGCLARHEPEFLGVQLAVAVAIGDVEGACHGVIAPRLVARDKAVGVAIEGAEGMRDIRSGLALEAAAGGQRCYSNHQSANHAIGSAGFVPAPRKIALFFGGGCGRSQNPWDQRRPSEKIFQKGRAGGPRPGGDTPPDGCGRTAG